MKKLYLCFLVLIIAMNCLGCGNTQISFTEIEFPTQSTEIEFPTQNKIETYKYTGDINYVPISYQHVDDGTNGMDIIEYVDLSTGVIYLYTEKYQSGYATTWEMVVDASGNPIVYKNLEELRKTYNYLND